MEISEQLEELKNKSEKYSRKIEEYEKELKEVQDLINSFKMERARVDYKITILQMLNDKGE